jgi:hypothetical protein
MDPIRIVRPENEPIVVTVVCCEAVDAEMVGAFERHEQVKADMIQMCRALCDTACKISDLPAMFKK